MSSERGRGGDRSPAGRSTTPGAPPPAPDELLESVVGATLDLIARARTPLAAEQVVCDLIGTVELAAPPASTWPQRAELRDLVVSQVIAAVQLQRNSAALALLRVCSVLGSPATRAAAATAARRVAAAGVRDRVWAADLGRPRGVRAWWYADAEGRQESVGVLFEYGTREHAVTVLIDHTAGGGILDCWTAEGREARELRHQTEALVAREPSHEFADIELGEAAVLLAAAVAAPVCPREMIQMEAVAGGIELVRARAELLTLETRAAIRRRRGPRTPQ